MHRHELKSAIDQARSGTPIAYCRLVETRGSTPQKAGATMLIYADGSQRGTLGGGCVEAEVKRKAIEVLQGTSGVIVRFQLDHDYGWDDGLICGGRMTVLIQPMHHPDAVEYFNQLEKLQSQFSGFTEAVVFEEKLGIAEGTMMLFDQHQQLVSWLGGNSAEQVEQDETEPKLELSDQQLAEVKNNLKALDDRPLSYAEQGVGYLTQLTRCPLIIVGGGHIGQAVAELASSLNFDVTVIDDRAEFISEDRFPTASQRLSGDLNRVLPELTISSDTYCLIVTRGHNHDQLALYRLIGRGARYIGMIGSRRKIRLIFDNLLDEGVTEEALAEVFAPVGVDIGSQTVPEIAISICAELVSHRNCQGKVPGRPSSVLTK